MELDIGYQCNQCRKHMYLGFHMFHFETYKQKDYQLVHHSKLEFDNSILSIHSVQKLMNFESFKHTLQEHVSAETHVPCPKQTLGEVLLTPLHIGNWHSSPVH